MWTFGIKSPIVLQLHIYNNFKHFKPAHKFYPFIRERRKILMDDTNFHDAKAYYEYSENVFRISNSGYFTMKESLTFYFSQKMSNKWNNPIEIGAFF